MMQAMYSMDMNVSNQRTVDVGMRMEGIMRLVCENMYPIRVKLMSYSDQNKILLKIFLT